MSSILHSPVRNNYRLQMLQNAMYIHLFVVQTLQPALHYDTELNMQSIAEVVKSTAEINANEIDTILYSRLSYNKGETRK